ncbi:hypothetical protein [Acidithiobacillus sulfurivorans]|uniref:Uncharacterized protein n=1 Tax=Acidithiobacillus sulfurivorans TaxID=1958756 RepID=A0ABS6A205_9PROT|nr:hypothetical protein [Acidithiobacillus sulfurivorans]MBU2761469.1 hypothetical protein [Acidithiobacillus sulfurivorans]
MTVTKAEMAHALVDETGLTYLTSLELVNYSGAIAGRDVHVDGLAGDVMLWQCKESLQALIGRRFLCWRRSLPRIS